MKSYKYLQNKQECISEAILQILQLKCPTKHSEPRPPFDKVSEMQADFYNFSLQYSKHYCHFNF